MSAKSLVIWILTLVTLLIGLAGIIAGAVGVSWWTNDVQNIGLWRGCNSITDKCENRDELLEFKDSTGKNREMDAVFLVLIISGGFAFYALIAVLSMLCCQRNVDGWKCGALMSSLFIFIAAVSAFAALVFAEVEFADKWDTYDHGWSIIICWVGAGILGLAFIFSFTLICTTARDDHPSTNVSYSQNGYDRTGMAARGAHANRGYELR